LDPTLSDLGRRLAASIDLPLKEHSMQLAHFTQKFIRDEEGVTAIEYGLIAALIAVAIIVSVSIVGTQLALVFGKVSTALTAAL
jgi:pilus assembly protein Flp/PilA